MFPQSNIDRVGAAAFVVSDSIKLCINRDFWQVCVSIYCMYTLDILRTPYLYTNCKYVLFPIFCCVFECLCLICMHKNPGVLRRGRRGVKERALSWGGTQRVRPADSEAAQQRGTRCVGQSAATMHILSNTNDWNFILILRHWYWLTLCMHAQRE